MLKPLSEVSLAETINDNRLKHSIIIAVPNYEERSIAFLQEYYNPANKAKKKNDNCHNLLLWPNGTAIKVDLLERLKAKYYDRILPLILGIPTCRETIEYPDNYNTQHVESIVVEACTVSGVKDMCIYIDISSMPRIMIHSVCNAIVELMRENKIADNTNIYFAYTSPDKYAKLRYAQNIGGVRGCYSGRPIHECKKEHIYSYIFPSLQGYEGKLLYDELKKRVYGGINMFVAISGTDYITSLSVIRANQYLMEQKGINIIYYFSIIDGLEKYSEALYNDVEKLGKIVTNDRTMLLSAPFGPKIFNLASYYLLRHIKRIDKIDTEMAIVSGFQYLSLYSVGVGKIRLYKLNYREY